MPNWLQDCARKFGAAPREFSFWDRLTCFRIDKPSWLLEDPTDGLTTLFENLSNTFANGVVVWGHIVQANSLMFEAGKDNCPGDVVYSIDDRKRIKVEDLRQIAHQLYGLKGTAPVDVDLLSIANYLADEMVRVFGLPVPRSISPAFRCKISTTFIVRKHLPGRRLRKTLLPLVVNPHEPHVAMPLPQKYWPQGLLSWWTQ